jgi:hypothetical protein
MRHKAFLRTKELVQICKQLHESCVQLFIASYESASESTTSRLQVKVPQEPRSPFFRENPSVCGLGAFIQAVVANLVSFEDELETFHICLVLIPRVDEGIF